MAFLVYQDVWASEPLEIMTKTGSVCFWVERAESAGALKKGLMDRPALAAQNGMLFIFPQVRLARFWMKNTYIPLDILFLDEKGVIVHIHLNAQPLSEKYIYSEAPVKAALEIPAGEVKLWGIKKGDFLRHPIFNAKAPACPTKKPKLSLNKGGQTLRKLQTP